MPKRLYSDGYRSGKTTVTVSELIEWLKQFPEDTAVAYTWEGQVTPISFADTEVIEYSQYGSILGPVLLLNAET